METVAKKNKGKKILNITLITIISLLVLILITDAFYGIWVKSSLTNTINNTKYSESGLIKGAEPFELKANSKVSCLLVHGFCDSPKTMKYLGNKLNKAGFNVKAIRLPGHGTNALEMSEKNWKDWYSAVKDEYKNLKSEYDKVFVAGFSMGGALTLKLAQEESVDGIICFAPFQRVTKVLGFSPETLMGILKNFMLFTKFIKKTSPPGISDVEARKEFIDYNYLPISCIISLFELAKITENNLSKITCPILILHGKKDKSADPEQSKKILEKVSSKDKNIFYFENSEHVLIMDVEKDKVIEKALERLNKWKK